MTPSDCCHFAAFAQAFMVCMYTWARRLDYTPGASPTPVTNKKHHQQQVWLQTITPVYLVK